MSKETSVLQAASCYLNDNFKGAPMAPSRRLGRLVVLCALATAHEPTEHERLDTDYDHVVKTRSKGRAGARRRARRRRARRPGGF